MLEKPSGSRRAHLAWLILACSTVGCSSMQPQGDSLLPINYQLPVGPFVGHTNEQLAGDAASIQDLRTVEQEIAQVVQIKVDPAAKPIDVYVLKNREDFAFFLKYHHPDLPARRAFFIVEDGKGAIYTYAGERLGEDLRHEATHAILHASVQNLPLWLDEGFAEYFESPDKAGSLGPEHVVRSMQDIATGRKPDLERLEKLNEVREMEPADYRESWAWVHLYLNSTQEARAELLGFVYDLKNQPAVASKLPLSKRPLASTGTDSLASHLKAMPYVDPEAQRVSAATQAPEPPSPQKTAEPAKKVPQPSLFKKWLSKLWPDAPNTAKAN
jgi:hypothetical protein